MAWLREFLCREIEVGCVSKDQSSRTTAWIEISKAPTSSDQAEITHAETRRVAFEFELDNAGRDQVVFVGAFRPRFHVPRSGRNLDDSKR